MMNSSRIWIVVKRLLASGNLFPQYASTIAAVVLGAVTVFETIGPPISSYAFRLSGETAKERARIEAESEADVPAEGHAPIDEKKD